MMRMNIQAQDYEGLAVSIENAPNSLTNINQSISNNNYNVMGDLD